MDASFSVFAGVDWAERSHAVCALVPSKSRVGAFDAIHKPFENTPEGISLVADWLAGLGRKHGPVAVAIEVPHGPIAEGLLLRGLPIFSINPKLLDRHRDRYSVAGAKDDRRDAMVLADSLRIDRQSFREVIIPSATAIQLRAVYRHRSDRVDCRIRLTNQLRSELLACAPHYLRLSNGANERWFLELLRRLSAPGNSTLANSAVAALLKEYRISKVSAAEVLAIINAEPLLLAPGTFAGCAFVISSLLGALASVNEQLANCDWQCKVLLDALRLTEDGGLSDVEIIDSYPGAGPVVLAGLFAEAQPLITIRDYQALRAHSGVAPVTRQTGKQGKHAGSKVPVFWRLSVNPQLREVVFYLADAAYKVDPWAKAYYREQRGRGKSHGCALRCLGDRILHQLMAMLTTRTLYDPSKRKSPVPAAAAA